MAANVEVQKLLEAGFIRECQYLEWISNVVLVKKRNGTWRMCVDFIDLNKALWSVATLLAPLRAKGLGARPYGRSLHS